MNRQRYQLVFNRHRGMLMAVAETASVISGQGMSIAGGIPSRVADTSWRFAPLAFALALVWQNVTHAQILVDRNAPREQQPMVVKAANGVPVINIQQPNAKGLSVNSYRRFDVDERGAILNNSAQTSRTELGGYVAGNPWMPRGGAQVIVNQINSPDPSYLRGFIEVAGNRAQVIIANPSGITCAGCGFINAQRATMTTGRPVIGQGNLESYRVGSGMITFEGAGMDAGNTGYVDVIARAVRIHAALRAKQIKVTTGLNTVSADHAQVTPDVPASDAAPVRAIDVAQLGGMYAGHIYLSATEHGVAHTIVGGMTGGLAGAAGAAAGTLTAPNVSSALKAAGVDPDLAKALTGLSSTLAGAAVGGTAGGAEAFNEVVNNYLRHDERIALKKAKYECYATANAASCKSAEILEKKDAVSNARIEQSIAACEGESCNTVAKYIKEELVATGCSIPNVCRDNELLQAYWKAAQGKAQGLQQVEVESWLIDAKAAYDLAKFAFGFFNAGRITTRIVGSSTSEINVAKNWDAPFSPIVDGGGLQAHENSGGHLLLKHAGQTEQDLWARLANEPKITGSSSFYDRVTAERAVSQIIDANQKTISNWLLGPSVRLRIDYTFADSVGVSVSRGATSAVDVNSARIILIRDSSLPNGYKILTGFPTK